MVNRMIGKKKKRRILLLTIISQLILGVFVVYWLIAQFNAEKEQLEKELIHQYLAAENQVVDSILLKQLINPVLGDSIQLTLNLKKDSTNIVHFQQDLDLPGMLRNKSSSDSNRKIIAFGLVNEPDSQQNNEKTYHFNKVVKEDALKRSVKLIINHTDSIDKEHVKYRKMFPFPVDSGLFKRIFSDSLTGKEMSFAMDWYVDSDSNMQNLSGINIRGGMYENVPSVAISKYGSYILGQILPQILFAIFLLILSGAALMFSYKNFKKQLQLNILRADFISNITHELKTPVSTAKVALEALLNFDMKKDTEVADKYLKMVEVEMNRLDSLTNKVLSHSKIEAQGLIIQKEKANLSELVQSVLTKMRVQFEESDAIISFKNSEGNYSVEADPVYTERVITNLLDNSLKYASSNPNIEFSIAQDEKYVKILVEDNGPGIPTEYLTKVFDNFFRVPTGNKHNVKGYGLGLSFASMIMKQHKGKIEVENLPERGCRFTLKFPK